MSDFDDLDLLPPIRDALMGEAEIAGVLEQWKGEPAIFTRRPVPKDAPALMVLIDQTTLSDADALRSDRPIWGGQILFYGVKGEPGTPQDQTRVVEKMAYRARTLFHRQRFSVRPTGFSVIDVRAGGPMPAPTDDDQTVGRLLTLTVLLRRQRP